MPNRLEDTLKNHSFYFKAAKLAINIYLQLHDNPLPDNVDSSATANGQPTLHPIENGHAKKSKKERKQAKAEANKAEQNKQNQAQKGKEKEESFASTLHTEPLIPKDLEHPKNALADAERFLKPLQTLSAHLVDTHLLSFELYLRKQKPLLMLKSLQRSIQIAPNHPALKQQLETFVDFVHRSSDKLHADVGQVIEMKLPKLRAAVDSLQSDLSPVTSSLSSSFAKLTV